MVCYHPLTAWMRLDKCNPNGKKTMVFSPSSPTVGEWKNVQIPCGQCIGCRLAYSKAWAVRCVHEAKLHPQNTYLTLTYNDDSVPWSFIGEQTLVKKHLQDFFKRLRKFLGDHKVRYFACGEYGDTTHRPHYHIILFNYRFLDEQFFSISKDGNAYYISPTLEKLWKHGQCLTAEVTYETCAYVARYVTKKLTGELGQIEYEGIQPPFVVMSRRPGIGKYWFDKYYKDVYPYDEVVIDGRKLRPPRYYDDNFAFIDADKLLEIKQKRMERAEKVTLSDELYTSGRLERKEEFQKEKYKSYKREGV